MAEYKEMQAECDQYIRERRMRGKSHGPCYSEPESSPLVWYDQIFESGVTPAGTVTCAEALRVGSTQNGLDIILVASASNAGELRAAAGATVTITTLQADSPNGEFKEVGPTICHMAPEEGITANPGHLFARVAIGNFSKPWLKIKLVFDGTITGGTIDAALSYVAR